LLIETRGLKFRDMISYPDLKIESGQVTFLCGESGSGKSTLLKLINGITSPTEGRLLVEDKDLADMNTVELRRKYLLVSQTVYLFEGSVRQNFEQFYEYRELAIPDDNEIQRFMDLCCADFPIDSSCISMSGGERQRVFLAICLSFKPRVLMLDEPTSALDAATAGQLMRNITEYCRNQDVTMIAVSHDRSLAERFADKIIELRGGAGA
jgi:putative ABC transport system ATP-binding protein